MEGGELLKVGARPSREEAEKFVTALRQWWPAEYIVQEAESPAGIFQLKLPAQMVDATPCNQLIRQRFPIENRSAGPLFIKPIQGSVLV